MVETAQQTAGGEASRQAPTIKDVAAALGVSVMTVSNAYNRPDQIAATTRERVLAEAARLGYAGPNPTARCLRRRRTGVIGILSRAPLSYAFSDPAAVLFTQGVSLASEAARLGLLLLSGASPDNPAVVRDAAVDGFLAISMYAGDPVLRIVLGRRLPAVAVDSAPQLGVPVVGIDDAGGARTAAEHVLTLGHRRIGVIALGGMDAQGEGRLLAPNETLRHPVVSERLRGYREALAEYSIPPETVPVYRCAQHTSEAGAQAARVLLTLEPRPTALLAMSDQLAVGALTAARDLGLPVPGDLSLVGFDDIPLASWLDPALTTIRQPILEKGRRAAEVLLASLRGEAGQPERIVLPAMLVPRATTSSPPVYL